jgi:hypothetical protein
LFFKKLRLYFFNLCKLGAAFFWLRAISVQLFAISVQQVWKGLRAYLQQPESGYQIKEVTPFEKVSPLEFKILSS